MKIRKSESIFIDFIYQNGEEIPDGYLSKVEILKDNKVVFSKQNNKSDDKKKFELRVTSEDTSDLKGKYQILVSFYNNNIGYLDYILDEELEVI